MLQNKKDQNERRHIESGGEAAHPAPSLLYSTQIQSLSLQLFLMVLDKSALKSIWESKGPRITNCEEEQIQGIIVKLK